MAVESRSDKPGQVLKFRPLSNAARRAGPTPKPSIVRLLDLSKYDRPPEPPDDFKTRMRQNIAALILLGVLVGVAATDFADLEHDQQCTSLWDCAD